MTGVYQREIEGLHRFFVAWFRGELARTPEIFARFTAATAPGFTLISPDGGLIDRAAAIDWIENAHGSRTDFDIWIEDFRLHQQHDKIAVVTYEEWQRTETGVTARLSTALFAHDGLAPNGVVWLHVHETWLPGRPTADAPV